MATAYNPQAWSITPASNDGADSGIGAVGNTSSPAVVDDWTKGQMAAIKRHILDTEGGLVAGGSANAITLTTNQSLSGSHIAAGLMLSFRVTATNTGAVTLNPDSTGAVAIVDQSGNALTGGELVAGSMAQVMYNANTSNWRLVSAYPTGVGTTGTVLLTSGTVSIAATLDIDISGYTAYRGLKLFLSGWRPSTTGAELAARFSTDGGSTFLTTNNYSVGRVTVYGSPASGGGFSGSTSEMRLTSGNVGDAATEGVNAELTIQNQTSTAFYPRIEAHGAFFDTSGNLVSFISAGGNKAANDVTDVRLMFSTGNITAGNYAVHGLV